MECPLHYADRLALNQRNGCGWSSDKEVMVREHVISTAPLHLPDAYRISSGRSPRRYLLPQFQPVVVFLPFSAMQTVKGVSVASTRTSQWITEWITEGDESFCRPHSILTKPSPRDEESGRGGQRQEARACLSPWRLSLCCLSGCAPEVQSADM